jgi:hypothetical protein
MIIPPKFLILKAIPLYNEGDVSAPNKKLMKIKEIKDRIFIKSLDHKMTMGLMEAKKIVDDLTIQYDMNNIYRIRLVE